MDRTDRIARLLSIPLLLLIGVLVFNEYRERNSPADVTAEDEEGTSTTSGGFIGLATTTTSASASSSDRSTSTTAGGSSTTTDSSSTGSSTTTTAAEAEAVDLDLPEADPAAPPQEPAGVYSDGKVVLRGSVPDAELAAGYLERAGSVLGEANVTMEMTLDPRVQGESMTIEVQEQFKFPEGAVTFDPKFEALLDLGAAALQLLPEATLVVTGHTDDVGTDATNIALSQARAQVVVDWMVGKGVDPARVIARGAGESEPIADNATPEGRDANRRIEAVLEGVKPA
jgi:outer membrane protein OmpA-like peptidoglycan-associated protein